MSEFVKNAADKEQVKEAGRKERFIREQEIRDLQTILSMKEGRRFVWRLMSHCKAFHSIWEPSAKIHYNAGQQDVGHFVMAEVTAASEDALLLMMKESKQGEF
jgi:hypothetical protein